jgi:hypothetical protein
MIGGRKEVLEAIGRVAHRTYTPRGVAASLKPKRTLRDIARSAVVAALTMEPAPSSGDQVLVIAERVAARVVP